jgi:hypothetical protein
MVKWLRSLKLRWRRARGQRLFETLCRCRDPLERHRIRMRLEEKVVPPDGLGWSRYFIAVLAAVASQAALIGVPRHLDERFNLILLEFATTYPGRVPNNLAPRELSAFAARVARRRGPSERRV